MSTYLYLTCDDHTPPLPAEDESGQHLYDLPRIRDEIAHRDFIVRQIKQYGTVEGYFTLHSARFLHRHQSCRIGIKDEYGRRYAIDGDDEAPLTEHDLDRRDTSETAPDSPGKTVASTEAEGTLR